MVLGVAWEWFRMVLDMVWEWLRDGAGCSTQN